MNRSACQAKRLRDLGRIRRCAERALASYREIFGERGFWNDNDRRAFAALDVALKPLRGRKR